MILQDLNQNFGDNNIKLNGLLKDMFMISCYDVET